MNLSVPFVALDVAVAASFLLLAAVGVHRRGRPGAGAAASLWFVLAVLAFVFAFGRVDVISGRVAVYAVIIGWMVAVPLWAGFVFAYTGRGPSVTRRWMALAGVYVTALGAVSLNLSAFDGMLGSLLQMSTAVLQTALIGVGLFAVFLLVRSAVTYDDLPAGQAVALAVGGVCVSVLSFSTSGLDSIDPATLPVLTTAFLGVTVGAFSVGVFRYRLFSEAPGMGPLARTSVFDEMSEAVVVVDRDRRLVDANEAAERTLGVTVARDAGRPVEAILGYDPGALAGDPATVPTPDGRRRFDVGTSALTNARDDVVGTSYLFQDVTDRRTAEQRLEVLNRVLRHNLRNDLDAVRGFSEALSDGTVDDTERTAERIRGTARELVDIGETVERADRIMTRDAVERRQFDLPSLVENVVADVRGAYECRIEVSVRDDDLALTTDREILRTALREVVENAAEHGDCPEPTVEVELSRTVGGARITVRDDGPGIPERERAVLLEGEETPLQHGAGVGLWFVSWAVTRLGGELSFEDGVSGSGVVLDVPDRSPDRE